MTASQQPLPRASAARIAEAFRPPRAFGNRWDYYYAREKLASDPLYPAVLDALQGCEAPLLDVGCGLGLLAHALRANDQGHAYRGVDIDAGKIERARRAAGVAALPDTTFETIDLMRGLPAHAGSVTILDVLQYLPADAQQHLLDASIAMLAPGARLVIRAALDDAGSRSRATRVTDWIGHLSGWMQSRPRHYPHADVLRDRFDRCGLRAEFTALPGRMPLNHWLIVAERRDDGGLPRAGSATHPYTSSGNTVA